LGFPWCLFSFQDQACGRCDPSLVIFQVTLFDKVHTSTLILSSPILLATLVLLTMHMIIDTLAARKRP
jgi:hypothetical protein